MAVTQVLSIVFRSAAYPNPIDESTWSAGQIAFYSSLFMVWLACLVLWKPLLGILNDKLGLPGMLIISTALMALAIVYLPSMLYGTPVIFMYAAMVMMSAGISNATVTPPLVVAQAMGGRDFGQIFSLAVAFYYAGNALGAPLWGMLGTAGHYRTGMYLSPVLLAIFVLGCLYAARRGRATYLAEPVAGPPSDGPVPPDARVAKAQQADGVEAAEPAQQPATDDGGRTQPAPGRPQRTSQT